MKKLYKIYLFYFFWCDDICINKNYVIFSGEEIYEI